MVVNGSDQLGVRGFPLLKVRPGAKARMVLQSDNPVEVWTHWVGRRLWCGGPGCPGCDATGARLMLYSAVTAQVGDQMVPMIVETTPSAWDALALQAQALELELGPGLVVEASRQKAKSPTRFQAVSGGGLVVEGLTDVRITLSAAGKLAGLPAPARDEALADYFSRVRPRVLGLLAQALGLDS